MDQVGCGFYANQLLVAFLLMRERADFDVGKDVGRA
jgi:hypothetical protein